MLNKNIVKGLLLDYGGTIDTNGVHWAIVLWQHYKQLQIAVSNEAFREAYVHGERTLATQPLIKPEHNFYDLLLIKAQIQIDYLIDNNYLPVECKNASYPEQIARQCYDLTRKTILQAIPTLDFLVGKYPIVLVSNFYGNIETVLNDFSIGHYFEQIVESAVVGVRKPDPAIWLLGAKALQIAPEQAIVIGDSYDKDIVSGKKAGCQTIWLDVSGWDKLNDTLQADEIITNFTILKSLLK